jgi:hypothetical protein
LNCQTFWRCKIKLLKRSCLTKLCSYTLFLIVKLLENVSRGNSSILWKVFFLLAKKKKRTYFAFSGVQICSLSRLLLIFSFEFGWYFFLYIFLGFHIIFLGARSTRLKLIWKLSHINNNCNFRSWTVVEPEAETLLLTPSMCQQIYFDLEIFLVNVQKERLFGLEENEVA